MPARQAGLRIRRRTNPLAALLPAVRWLATAALIVALLVGSWRWLTRSPSAGALEFTQHIVGIETGAVGVLGIATSDIDDDGDIDIITAGLDGIKVYINNGSQSFEQKLIDDKDGERVQIIDLDKDGAQDLLVTLKNRSPSVRWYRNTGNVEFSGTDIGTGTDAKAYAGDVDADGSPDIITATDQGGLIVLQRWMNNGSGTFAATTLDSDSKVTAVTVSDVNGNGYPDIITTGTNGLQRWDTSDGLVWSEIDIDSDNPNKSHVVTADVNKDGKTDIVTADQSTDVAAYYRNQDNSTFQRVALSGSLDATTVTVKDLDEDGDEDIIVSGQDDNGLYWFDNNGSDEFTKRTIATNLQSVFGLAVADLDGDNDFDFVAGDHFRGTVYWYERTRARPVATAPSNIQQTTDGAGRITFDTTLSDDDKDPTRIRVQYSTDGKNWYKPWIIKVTANNGKVDLKNSNGYQIGTSNAIDTDSNDSVKLTLIWDTKSVENTGGPISGDVGTVKLRVIPRDDSSVGSAAVSGTFRVDNSPPQGLANLKLVSITDNEAEFSWTAPTDSSAFEYKLYYGTDRVAVLEQRSAVWDKDDDPTMADVETTSTTIQGLAGNKPYTFKLFVVDAYGSLAAVPSLTATTPPVGQVTSPTPTAPAVSPTVTPTTTPGPTPTVTPSPTATTSPSVTPLPSPTPPSTLQDNQAPTADAGPDQVVNPNALVILDGTASSDPDQDSLVYAWRQLSGPEVDVVSERTATPSFSAGGENETYIFSLTVRDSRGASSTDTVTVATKALPVAQTTPVTVVTGPTTAPADQEAVITPLQALLSAIDTGLFGLAFLFTLISLGERTARAIRHRRSAGPVALPADGGQSPRGRVLHYKSGEPIVGAQVFVYDSQGKLRATERTNRQGEFASLLPVGQYTIGVTAEGFAFAPVASGAIKPEYGILYTGGKLTVKDGSEAINIVIPMKPTGQEVSRFRTRQLHLWQSLQRIGRILSWPIFVLGALLNTILVFWIPNGRFLLLEVLYIVLVIIKIALEVRVRPAYGLVRDVITHVPLDLAVVRLFEQGTNRLVMTRVTNNQGKFFALPPAGTYTITVTKPGYAVFSKQNVQVSAEHDSALQMTAELMPLAPTGGLQAARAAVL